MDLVDTPMYFSLSDLRNIQAALSDGSAATTTAIAEVCGWDQQAAWGELKLLEKLQYIEKVDAKPPFYTPNVKWRVKPDGALETTIAQEESLERENAAVEGADIRFVRCGRWCSCLKSQIGTSKKFEAGISAYASRRNGTTWQPTDRAFWRKNFGTATGSSPWYLLTGLIVGMGSDGEPVLKEAYAVARLAWHPGRQAFDVVPGACPAHPRFDHQQCMPAIKQS